MALNAGPASGADAPPLPIDPSTIQAAGSNAAETYGALPMTFEPNVGQADGATRFVARGAGYAVALDERGATLALRTPVTDAPRVSIGVRFINAAEPRISAEQRTQTRVNYLLGSDPANWHVAVPTYGRVRYAGVWPGIDVAFYGGQQSLEYDFVVAPGADPADIGLSYVGTERVTIDSDGSLLLQTTAGVIRQQAPVAYQDVDGVREAVDSRYVNGAGGARIGIAVGSYDDAWPLVIDPIVSYSTFLGGSDSEAVTDIAVDAAGRAYVTGTTVSTNFPKSRAKIGTGALGGSEDAFVSELNATGTALVYSTYLGGSSNDEALALAIDGSGRAYIGGYTISTDFPHTSHGLMHDTTYGDIGEHAFIAVLAASGASLAYGGTFDARMVTSIAVWHNDAANRDYAYLVGETSSMYYPTTANAYDQQCGGDPYCSGGPDAFFMKLQADNSLTVDNQLKYSTVLGGTATGTLPGDYLFDDRAFGVAVGPGGDAYVTGETKTTDFPTTAGAFDRTCGTDAAHNCSPNAYGIGTYDAFVARIDPTASGNASLVYSTYLGGARGDTGRAVAVDGSGNAYVTGVTSSANFPTTAGAQDRTCGTDGNCNQGGGEIGSDAFVVKVGPTGDALAFSTFYGGSADEVGTSIALDAGNNVFFTGTTASSNLPLANAIVRVRLSESNLRDIFVARLAPAGALKFSSYFGSIGDEAHYFFAFEADPVLVTMPKIAVARSTGAAYVGGVAGFDDFPFTNVAYDKVCGNKPSGGGCYSSEDGFVMKISPPAMNDYCPVPQGAIVAGARHADPSRVIVRFRTGFGRSRQAHVLASASADVVTALPLINAQVVQSPGRSAVELARALAARPEVQYATVDGYARLTGYADEPAFPKQWGLRNVGQVIPPGSQEPDDVGIPDRDIDGTEAAKLTLGNPDLVVAVIDSGVDFTHPDLAGQSWKNPGESGGGRETNGRDDDHNGYVDDVVGWDFFNGDKTVYDTKNQADHGTVVAGIIAARINGKGTVGVAPNVRIMALKVGGAAGIPLSKLIEAIQYAANKHVRIANASLGFNTCNVAVKDAIRAASSMLFVASSGNGGADGWRDNNDIAPTYPASYDVPTIISVAAIDNRGRLADFSNWGYRNVDIAAPGVNIWSPTKGHTWGFESGTSMAAPFVAGVAALGLSVNPALSVTKLRSLILATGMSLPSLKNRIASGRVVNARALVDAAHP